MRVFELFDFKRLFSFSQEINFSDLRRQVVKKKERIYDTKTQDGCFETHQNSGDKKLEV